MQLFSRAVQVQVTFVVFRALRSTFGCVDHDDMTGPGAALPEG